MHPTRIRLALISNDACGRVIGGVIPLQTRGVNTWRALAGVDVAQVEWWYQSAV
jgi:hypothetical protein